MFWFISLLSAVFLLLFILLLLLALLQYCRNLRSPLRCLPGFTSYNPLLGNLNYGSSEDLMERWLERLNAYGSHPYRFYSVLGMEWVGVMSAADAKQILSSNSRRYCRITKIPGLGLFDVVVGETSMLLTDGEVHQRHKNLCSMAFRPSSIRRLFPHIHSCCASLIDFWGQQCDASANGILMAEDIRKQISRGTLTIIGLVTFGLNFDCIGHRKSALSDNFEKIMAVTVVWRHWYVLPFSPHFPHPVMKNFWVGLKGLENAIEDIVDWHSQRRNLQSTIEPSGRLGCLLETILEANSHVGLNKKELRDEMMTFLMAGHETSSLGLTWTLYLLAKHPQIQQKCYQEVQRCKETEIDIDVDSDSWEQNPLEQLKYLKAVVQESLRLYPPVPNLARRAVESDILPSKVTLPKGTRIVINVAMIHRNPEYWDEPNTFRPERFLQPDAPLYAFFPFGEGIHKCIGYKLALAEMTLMLSALIGHFHFELSNSSHKDNSVRIRSAITLQPATPVRLNISRR